MIKIITIKTLVGSLIFLCTLSCSKANTNTRNVGTESLDLEQSQLDFSDRCAAPNAQKQNTTYHAVQKKIQQPWNAVAQLVLEDNSICSAVLLSSTQLLTSAHCFELTKVIRRIQFDTQNEDVLLGASKTTYKQISLHPKYVDAMNKGFTLSSHPEMAFWDMAVVELQSPSLYTPIPVVDKSSLKQGELLHLVGFGDAGMGAGQKRLAQTHYWKLIQAMEPHSFAKHDPRVPELVLLNSKSGTGACKGDSGGGIFVKDSLGNYGLIGIVQGINERVYPGFSVSACHVCPNGLGIVVPLAKRLSELRSLGVRI